MYTRRRKRSTEIRTWCWVQDLDKLEMILQAQEYESGKFVDKHFHQSHFIGTCFHTNTCFGDSLCVCCISRSFVVIRWISRSFRFDNSLVKAMYGDMNLWPMCIIEWFLDIYMDKFGAEVGFNAAWVWLNDHFFVFNIHITCALLLSSTWTL
jgi:hypothetical protein